MSYRVCPTCERVCDGTDPHCDGILCGRMSCYDCVRKNKQAIRSFIGPMVYQLKVSVFASVAEPGYFQANIHTPDNDLIVSALSRTTDGATAHAFEKLTEYLRNQSNNL